MSPQKKLVLLGATGSIGQSTLRVLRNHKEKIELIGISANSQCKKLVEIANEFQVKHASLTTAPTEELSFPKFTNLHIGSQSLELLASLEDADIVVVAVVGAIGLLPTLAALKAGKDVVLANKESLVVGGEIVTETAKKFGAKIIPADSEHNAVFQCIHGESNRSIESVVLTASGGAFRDLPIEKLKDVSVEETLQHPNWSMGKKITVDSATMANKGLELIEAHWLFDLSPNKLEVVIHPPSIVHAIVRFVDGCCLAQMTPPSMTFALQNAILFPERHPSVDSSINFAKPLELTFTPPPMDRYPCLQLAQEALKEGKSAPLVYNAANEIAVDAFLRNRIGFLDISRIIDCTLNNFEFITTDCIDNLLNHDMEARKCAEAHLSHIS